MKASASGNTEETGWLSPGYTCSLGERGEKKEGGGLVQEEEQEEEEDLLGFLPHGSECVIQVLPLRGRTPHVP